MGGGRRAWLAALRAGPLGEPLLLLLLAAATGAIGGLGAVAFRLIIGWLQTLFRQGLGVHAFSVLGAAQRYAVALLPAVGLLIVGLISTYAAPEVKGHGVPQILEALALRGGRIRPRVGLFGILAPAVTIGSGGSVGREGPIALIGASFGSTAGQVLRLPEKYVSLLVGCGAAAGIAATFNAPIAGGLFGLEVVLGSFAIGTLVPVFVAAVVGVQVFQRLMGPGLVLPAPGFALSHGSEIALVVLLGMGAGLLGVAYTRGLDLAEEAFGGWRVPFWVKNLAGGLAVGALGLGLPQVLGVGYTTMEQALRPDFPVYLFLVLLAAKLAATTLTIGAGGSGGVFAPSLYLGMMLGGTFGWLVHAMAPGWAAGAGVYAIIGMGAVFAASAQAPLTAIVIILEMTGDYALTTSVMAACVLSYLVYSSLQRDSMYTVKLSRNGVRILRGSDVRPLQALPVSAAMTPAEPTVRPGTPLGEAGRLAMENSRQALVVLDADGLLAATVEAAAIFEALAEGRSADAVERVARPAPRPLFRDATLDEAMRRFQLFGASMIPVVDRATPRRVVGALTYEAAVGAYDLHTTHNLSTSARVRELHGLAGHEGDFREFAVDPGSACVGRSLADLRLPTHVSIVSIMRAGEVLVAHDSSVLQAGDRVLVFAAPSRHLEDVPGLLGLPAAAGSRPPRST